MGAVDVQAGRGPPRANGYEGRTPDVWKRVSQLRFLRACRKAINWPRAVFSAFCPDHFRSFGLCLVGNDELKRAHDMTPVQWTEH